MGTAQRADFPCAPLVGALDECAFVIYGTRPAANLAAKVVAWNRHRLRAGRVLTACVLPGRTLVQVPARRNISIRNRSRDRPTASPTPGANRNI